MIENSEVVLSVRELTAEVDDATSSEPEVTWGNPCDYGTEWLW